MLIQFSTENYLSFKGRVVLDLRAGAIKEFPENIFDPILDNNQKLLKCVGVYGANSSGKSNLIKAFNFTRRFIINSFKESQANDQIPFQPFKLAEETKEKPSTFETVFLIGDIKYKYGFTVNSQVVESEWLFQTIKRKEEYIFLRMGKDFTIQKKFKTELKNKADVLTDFTRSNSLFISLLSAHNIEIGTNIINWFSKAIIIKDSDQQELINFSAELMTQDDYRKLVNEIIKNADLGIDGVEQKINDIKASRFFSADFITFMFKDQIREYRINTRHKIYSEDNKYNTTVNFDLIENESSGTQKFFGLLGPILLALKEKRIILIDEIDSKIHTKLLETIVSFFNSNSYNRLGSQLIFTSHNTYIIKKKFRRDQMILVDKNKYGESKLGSLYKSFKKVRNDASFDKDYLAGDYSAIPKISITQLDLFGRD